MKGKSYTSYADLLSSRVMFDELLCKFGIAINSSDRLHTAYRYIELLFEAKNDHQKTKELYLKFPKGELLEALYNISELAHIIDQISRVDDENIAIKLKTILSGPFLQQNETEAVSEPRNTMFELYLLARFLEGGYSARIGSQGTDIELHTGGHLYFVECKRLFGIGKETYKRNVYKAAKQLDKVLNKNDGTFGIIALSIGRQFTYGSKLLKSKNVSTAMAFMKSEVSHFLKSIERFTSKPTIMRNNNIVGTILDFQTIAVLDDEPMFVLSELDIINTIFSTTAASYKLQLYSDLSNLEAPKSGKLRA